MVGGLVQGGSAISRTLKAGCVLGIAASGFLAVLIHASAALAQQDPGLLVGQECYDVRCNCYRKCSSSSWSLPPPPPEPAGPRQMAVEENLLGLVALGLRNFEEAIERFTAAQQHDPQEPAYQQNLQRAQSAQKVDHHATAARGALARGDFPNARRHLEEAIKFSDAAALRAELDGVNRARDQHEARRRTQQILAQIELLRSQEARFAEETRLAAQTAQSALARVGPQVRSGTARQQLEELQERGATPGAQDLLDMVVRPLSSPPRIGRSPPTPLPTVPPPEIAVQVAALQKQLDDLKRTQDMLNQQLDAVTDASERQHLEKILAGVKAEMDKVREKMIDVSFRPTQPTRAPTPAQGTVQ